MATRDEFILSTKRTLGERAAYICSNPACRTPTIGPHSDPEKSLKTGDACHIEAAAPGGPRFNVNQTEEQRRHISNGIWLCTECSRRVDADEMRYPAETLRGWKHDSEQWLLNGGIVPGLPNVSITTSKGLTLPDEPGTISGEEIRKFREHRFQIRNDASAPIFNIDAKVHLPEPILDSFKLDKPPGVSVQWEPIRPEITFVATGGGSVTRNGPAGPTAVGRLRIDTLPAESEISFRIVTSDEPYKVRGIDPFGGMWSSLRDPPNLKDFIDGTYSFPYLGTSITRRFFVAIHYDRASRILMTDAVSEDQGEWKLVEGFLFY